jgi:lysophospholipase III
MLGAVTFASLCWLNVLAAPLSPIIFLPGYSGSLLYATINDGKMVPTECQEVSIPIGQPFRVLGNISLEKESPTCVKALMETNFDEQTGVFLPKPGIDISTRDGFEGIAPVYWPLIQTFSNWGYRNNMNSFGVPYDYRYLGKQSLTQIGFISKLQLLIEKSYQLNHQKKAVLIGHSNGGPTLYYFLEKMSQEWKEKYLSAMIGLSGNFLGQLNGIKTFIYSENSITQQMMNTWEAQYNSLTWHGYQPSQTLVITYANTSSEKRYTTNMNDILALLSDGQQEEWMKRYQATSSQNDRSIAPTGVDVYCLYGKGIETSSKFVFQENILTDPPVETVMMNGDGNQDDIDNQFCESWRGDVEQGGYRLESQGYEGVRHMQMYLDENVLKSVYEILQTY